MEAGVRPSLEAGFQKANRDPAIGAAAGESARDIGPGLRFALNARPPGSQGFAPAGANN